MPSVWIPPAAFVGSAFGAAEAVVGRTGRLLSSYQTAPGVYKLPDQQTVDDVLRDVPLLDASPGYADTVLSLTPRSLWMLDSPALTDQGPNNLPGSVAGSVLFPGTSILPSGEGAAAQFDGANTTFISVPGSQSIYDFLGTANYSFVAWLRDDDTVGSTGRYAVSKRQLSPAQVGYISMYRDPTRRIQHYRYRNDGTNFNAIATTASFGAGTPIFCAVTFDGTTMRVSLNAGSQATSTPTVDGGLVSSGNDLYFGAPGVVGAQSSTWIGAIQGVAVFNRALMTDEIETIYRSSF